MGSDKRYLVLRPEDMEQTGLTSSYSCSIHSRARFICAVKKTPDKYLHLANRESQMSKTQRWLEIESSKKLINKVYLQKSQSRLLKSESQTWLSEEQAQIADQHQTGSRSTGSCKAETKARLQVWGCGLIRHEMIRREKLIIWGMLEVWPDYICWCFMWSLDSVIGSMCAGELEEVERRLAEYPPAMHWEQTLTGRG